MNTLIRNHIERENGLHEVMEMMTGAMMKSEHSAQLEHMSDNKANGRVYEERPDVDNGNRMYRNRKRKGRYHLIKHDWVTRPDPFLDVKEEIEQALQEEPHFEAKTLLIRIQKRYQSKYKDNQFRTLQRRVKEIRMEQVRKMTEEIGLLLEPEPV